ncbi:DUF6624 domain-containing protein [Parasediminibacterium sp. JCM 36343]|uniref:DUF6624 domain-containing protein n=1 Tax=Parasediminibacterium sp. JCM 36343 TaxID=3374279 RepID=UPI0039792FBC
MCKVYFIFLFSLFTSAIIGQKKYIIDDSYIKNLTRITKFYEDKKFIDCALSLDTLLDNAKGRGWMQDRYSASCAWALAGNSKKAFSYLKQSVIVDKYANLDVIIRDSDLVTLHTDRQWQPLIDIVKINKQKGDSKINKELIIELDTIENQDQTDRHELIDAQKKYGWDWASTPIDSMNKILKVRDSIRVNKIKTILDKYGWLGRDVIGDKGSNTLWLIIQHADSLTQVTYLPKLKNAVKKGNAEAYQLAMLIDRIFETQRKKQIYGSQVAISGKEFYPIKDEINVNKRRYKVALKPLEEYARDFGFVYQLPIKRVHK